MNDLLQLAVDAHGGLDRWNELQSLQTELSITGAIWRMKGKPDVFSDVTLTADLHSQHMPITPVAGAGRQSVLDDRRLSLETTSMPPTSRAKLCGPT
ncbi:MAG: hypothetical protein QOI01_6038 [Mycobacterium sp.]|jgi:hypothetical protein|nr:hypothetical protein [Mycobacterium sp.]